jgi:hypothetical protein
MKGKFYNLLPILHTFNGIRIDSGVNHSDFFSASNTEVQHQPIAFPPMDAQKRNDNIVMKLTNVNSLLNESVKFTELKKIDN